MNSLPHADECACPVCLSRAPALAAYRYETQGYHVVAVAMKYIDGTWWVRCVYQPKPGSKPPELPYQDYTVSVWNKLCQRKRDW